MTLPIASILAALLAAPAPEPVVVLRAARLFDGTGEMRNGMLRPASSPDNGPMITAGRQDCDGR